jgi:hypothetical protein
MDIRAENVRLPNFVAKYPAMLSDDDRRMYYCAARDHFRFKGAIVDLGAFLGGTTASLIAGALANPDFSPSTAPFIHVFDLFEAHWSMRAILDWEYGPSRVPDGSNIFSLYARRLRAFLPFLKINKGDVTEATWPKDHVIEVLGIDLCNSREITNSVVKTFFPRLQPGSIVLQQDYIHPWLPHIHTAMGYFADRFRVICECEVDAATVFEMVEPISDDEMDGFAAVCAHSQKEWLGLFDRAISQLTERRRDLLIPARTLLIAETFGMRPAQAYADHCRSRLDDENAGYLRDVLRYATKIACAS